MTLQYNSTVINGVLLTINKYKFKIHIYISYRITVTVTEYT